MTELVTKYFVGGTEITLTVKPLENVDERDYVNGFWEDMGDGISLWHPNKS